MAAKGSRPARASGHMQGPAWGRAPAQGPARRDTHAPGMRPVQSPCTHSHHTHARALRHPQGHGDSHSGLCSSQPQTDRPTDTPTQKRLGATRVRQTDGWTDPGTQPLGAERTVPGGPRWPLERCTVTPESLPWLSPPPTLPADLASWGVGSSDPGDRVPAVTRCQQGGWATRVSNPGSTGQWGSQSAQQLGRPRPEFKSSCSHLVRPERLGEALPLSKAERAGRGPGEPPGQPLAKHKEPRCPQVPGKTPALCGSGDKVVTMTTTSLQSPP